MTVYIIQRQHNAKLPLFFRFLSDKQKFKALCKQAAKADATWETTDNLHYIIQTLLNHNCIDFFPTGLYVADSYASSFLLTDFKKYENTLSYIRFPNKVQRKVTKVSNLYGELNKRFHINKRPKNHRKLANKLFALIHQIINDIGNRIYKELSERNYHFYLTTKKAEWEAGGIIIFRNITIQKQQKEDQ